MNKRAQMGEGIILIYRLALVTAIAFVVFGVSSFVYAHYIDVRDAEARILTRQVVDCLSPNGVLSLDEIGEESYNSILSYCDIPGDRFYVELDVLDSSNNRIAKLYEGDSGALWIKELYGEERGFFDSGSARNIKKYEPGYFTFEYPVFVLSGGSKIEGSVKMEVLVNYEE